MCMAPIALCFGYRELWIMATEILLWLCHEILLWLWSLISLWDGHGIAEVFTILWPNATMAINALGIWIFSMLWVYVILPWDGRPIVLPCHGDGSSLRFYCGLSNIISDGMAIFKFYRHGFAFGTDKFTLDFYHGLVHIYYGMGRIQFNQVWNFTFVWSLRLNLNICHGMDSFYRILAYPINSGILPFVGHMQIWLHSAFLPCFLHMDFYHAFCNMDLPRFGYREFYYRYNIYREMDLTMLWILRILLRLGYHAAWFLPCFGFLPWFGLTLPCFGYG